jgi:uncharacterized membrane protein YbhN (UPF0104 family)
LFAVSLGLLFANHLINVIRWYYILDQHHVSYSTLLVLYGTGLFSNNFLPTGIGGDGVRVALLNRHIGLGRAMFSVILDRGIGLIALSALFALGLIGGLPPGLDFGVGDHLHIPRTSVLYAPVALIILALVGLMAWQSMPTLHLRLIGAISKRAAVWDMPRWSVRRWLQRLSGAYLISVGSHLCIVAATWSTLIAMRIDVSPVAAIWLVVISSLSLLLPIAVNGMGVVEGVYVIVLGSYGVTSSIGLSVALIVRLIALLVSLFGGLLMLNRRAVDVEARC